MDNRNNSKRQIESSDEYDFIIGHALLIGTS